MLTCYFSFLFCYVYTVLCKWFLINPLQKLNDYLFSIFSHSNGQTQVLIMVSLYSCNQCSLSSHHTKLRCDYSVTLINEDAYWTTAYVSSHTNNCMLLITICYLNTHKHTETLFGFTFLYWTIQDNKKSISTEDIISCSTLVVGMMKCINV